MTSPRYVVRHLLFPSRYRLRDTWDDKWRNNRCYTKRRGAEKAADRLNAAILRKADEYRKAKDNG